MHKQLITLALASIASGAAFAQSNVTVYGIVDVGYGYYSDGNADDVKSIHKIDGNQWKTTRFGFKGSENLGDGGTITKSGVQKWIQSVFVQAIQGRLEGNEPAKKCHIIL